MVDSSEDSYLYMKSRSKSLYELDNERCSKSFYELDNERVTSSKNLSSRIPKPVEATTANHDDCMAFDLYEQEPDVDFECEDYNLRRRSSDFRFNFEDMIVLPIRLKKPPTSFESGTPPSTDLDEFDYADQHVYFSKLTTAVNSNSAIHEYGTRKGPLWDCAWAMLVPKGLHPAYLTESEFVKLVLSQGNDTAKWMDDHIPVLHRRALQKAASARQKLADAGISPFELTQEYLESFEWMDKIEQDNFVKTMQKLQLQVAFQKQGISMRIEDIDDITPVNEEELIGKSHTKLVDGVCIPRDHSSDLDESSMVGKMSLAEFKDRFWENEFRKAFALSSSVPIRQNHQPAATSDIGDEASSMKCFRSVIYPHSTQSSSSDKHPEHIENREVRENSDDVHQDTKNTYIVENGSLKLSQFPPLEASSSNSYTTSYVLPRNNPDTHIIFSLQEPPPLSPTRSAHDEYVSDSSSSVDSLHGSTTQRGKSINSRRHTKSSGSQSQISGKSAVSATSATPENSGINGRLGSIRKKLSDSPGSLKKKLSSDLGSPSSPTSLRKKLSSAFGTIGRAGKNKYHHAS